MTKEQIKNALPLIQAFAEGKIIQYRDPSLGIKEWSDLEYSVGVPVNNLLEEPNNYRVKPEPKYRPFANVDECWQEMLKHQPFGWTKRTSGHCNFLHIMELHSTGIVINQFDNFGCFKNLLETYGLAFAEITFADDTPFGIKED